MSLLKFVLMVKVGIDPKDIQSYIQLISATHLHKIMPPFSLKLLS